MIMKIKPYLITLVFTWFLGVVGCATQPASIQEPVAVPLSRTMPISPTTNLRNLASQAAFKYGIDHRLFHALVKHESAWNPYAISRKGARGLTQIMPITGLTHCGLQSYVLFDPKLNLECGASYFSKLLRRFKSVQLALAAYNSGETRVARLGRVPRIRETQRYVNRIMSSWRKSFY
jgi:soluble lytic murein transglycosylase-like protein